MKTEQHPMRGGGIALFGNLRVMVVAALLAALSIVLGKYLAINLSETVRLSFENLPLIMAGLFFGPLVGGVVGAVADLVGCILVGYAINPIITLGGILIGAVSGAIGLYAFPQREHRWGTWRVYLPVMAAHVVGSMVVKTIGMMVYYGTPPQIFLVRVPLYIAIGLLEGYLVMLLFRNKMFIGELNRIIHRKKEGVKMTYQQALEYIHSVSWKGSRPGLERITVLMERLGNPQNSLRFIHVAGTNGKGSTCAMTASILQQAGYRTGLFTSPFIVRFNERMRIDGEDIDDRELADITAYVKPYADGMEDVPTEFELITAIAFVYFARHRCDYVVLECGMGGRLDSTNVVSKESVALSVITGIAMDHTAFLGDTPEKIAAEKAGIIKRGVPVIFGGAHPPIGGEAGQSEVDPLSCAAVIRTSAEALDAPYLETDIRRLSRVRTDLLGAAFDFGEYNDLHISLPGVYQPCNAATVLSVVEVLRAQGAVISEDAVRRGLEAVRWPGRFEILSREPLLISDGGHNPEGIDAAVASVKAYFGEQKIQLLSGVMADKDYAYMVRRMSEVAVRVYTVRPDNSRALDSDAYAAVFEENGIPATGYATVKEAVWAAMDAGQAAGLDTLCLGSLYMYGEVKAATQEYHKEHGGGVS